MARHFSAHYRAGCARPPRPLSRSVLGTNNNRIPDASEKNSPWSRPWWFLCEFDAPASNAGRTVWLYLDGINYRAAVWVNVRHVENEQNTAGMFRRCRFDISGFIQPGKQNALAIRIFPADHAGAAAFRTPGSDPFYQTGLTRLLYQFD